LIFQSISLEYFSASTILPQEFFHNFSVVKVGKIRLIEEYMVDMTKVSLMTV
jgi:hypothetical protein